MLKEELYEDHSYQSPDSDTMRQKQENSVLLYELNKCAHSVLSILNTANNSSINLSHMTRAILTFRQYFKLVLHASVAIIHRTMFKSNMMNIV